MVKNYLMLSLSCLLLQSNLAMDTLTLVLPKGKNVEGKMVECAIKCDLSMILNSTVLLKAVCDGKESITDNQDFTEVLVKKAFSLKPGMKDDIKNIAPRYITEVARIAVTFGLDERVVNELLDNIQKRNDPRVERRYNNARAVEVSNEERALRPGDSCDWSFKKFITFDNIVERLNEKLPSVTRLNLSSNLIKNLDLENIAFNNYNVEEIDLKYNRIETIENAEVRASNSRLAQPKKNKTKFLLAHNPKKSHSCNSFTAAHVELDFNN